MSDAERAVAGEEQQQVVLERVAACPLSSSSGCASTVPSLRKWKQVMPPNAAMYWSCLPIGSRSTVDLDVAGLLGQLARMDQMLRACACRAPCSSAVVKLPDEPSPVPAGMSASVVISICARLDRQQPQRLADDADAGPRRPRSTCSSAEYFR